MHTFLALFSWESQIIYVDLKGWTLISVPDVKQTEVHVYLKAKCNSEP